MRIFLILVLAFYPYKSFACEDLQLISFVDLLMNGRSCNDCKVRVFGFYSIPNRLFLSRDHADNYDYPSSVQIVFKDDNDEIAFRNCIGRYISITGQISIDKTGYFSLINLGSPDYKGACKKD